MEIEKLIKQIFSFLIKRDFIGFFLSALMRTSFVSLKTSPLRFRDHLHNRSRLLFEDRKTRYSQIVVAGELAPSEFYEKEDRKDPRNDRPADLKIRL